LAIVTVHCPRCYSNEVYRHGRVIPKTNAFVTGHVDAFPSYEAQKAGVKKQIVDMAFSGSEVWDIAKALKVGINTVIRALKTHTEAGDILAIRSCRFHLYLRAG